MLLHVNIHQPNNNHPRSHLSMIGKETNRDIKMNNEQALRQKLNYGQTTNTSMNYSPT